MTRKEGYVVDIPYSFSFYKEMQPLWLTTVATFQGVIPPDINQPYHYCELGCGMGANLLIAAATNPQGHFIGIDFNASHIAQAQKIAELTGLRNIEFIQSDFATFAANTSYRFDFIVCHGTWSWIAASNKAAITDCIATMLQPRGMVYLHYMCHPGATRMLPLQKLMNEYASIRPGSSTENIQASLLLLRKLAAAGAFVDTPGLDRHLEALAVRDPNYLAHEFLSDYWQPEHSADIHRQMVQANVSYLGSANVFENIIQLSIPGAIQPVLSEVTEPTLRELIKDLARNQHQRSDLFQREPRRYTPAEYLQKINAIQFKYLLSTTISHDLDFNTPIGKITGPAAMFGPLSEKLQNSGNASVAELVQLPVFQQQPALLLQALQMLMWSEYAHPLPAIPFNSNTLQLQHITQWITDNAFPLRLVAECGTAVKL